MLSNAAKVERCYFDTHLLDPKHVRARLLDGLAQARDTRLPRVSVHRSFRKLVEDELPSLVQGAIRLVADVGVEYAAPPLRAACAGAGPDDRVLVAIGPEGGWVDFERGLLTANGFRPVSLGPRVLRSDIACVVALGLVHDALGARWASPPPAQSSRAAAP
jgi:RsmE family RNA methyltransferase